MEASDLSPSTIEFLEKEKFCLVEHKNTDDDSDCMSSDAKNCTGTISAPLSLKPPQDQTSNPSSDDDCDDDIGSLIVKMKRLLSPRDLEYLRSNEGKDVEELLRETEEFINESASLFQNQSVDSNSTESSSGMISVPKNIDDSESCEHVDELIKEMENCAGETTSVVGHLTSPGRETNDNNICLMTTILLNEANISDSSVDNKLEDEQTGTDNLAVLPVENAGISKGDSISENEEVLSSSSDSHLGRIDINLDVMINNKSDDSNFDVIKNYDCGSNVQNVKLSAESDENTDLLHCINENDRNNNSNNDEKSFNIVNVTHQLLNLNNEESNRFIADFSTKCLSNFNQTENDVPNVTNTNLINNNNINSNGSQYIVNNQMDDSRLRMALEDAVNNHKTQIEQLRKKYEEEIFKLKECINVLNAKVAKYESHSSFMETGAGDSKNVSGLTSEEKKIQELTAEIEKQEHLIAGYQRENKKMFADLTTSKELWKKEKLELEEKIRADAKLDNKNLLLQDQLKDAQEAIVRYQLELENYKELWKIEKMQLEEKLRETSSLDRKNLILQNQLKDAQETNVKFQLELENYKMEKMSDELLKWQADHDQLTDPSDLSVEIDSLKITVTQLQAALSVERTQKKNLSRDKDLLLRENMDLKRQVREVEGVLKRRSQSDSTLNKFVGEGRLKELEKELQARQAALSSMQAQLEEMQVKYNDHIIELEQRLKSCQEENNLFQQQLSEASKKGQDTSDVIQSNKQTVASSSSMSQLNSVYSQSSRAATSGTIKEDAHLLATIRGMKLELAKKDKELMKLNKELEDARKTNRRLQREREKQLKTGATQKPSSLQSSASLIKVDNKGKSLTDSNEGTFERPYNQAMFEEEHKEERALLKMENKSLREEIQRLGQDIVTLHTKRIQDLRALQSEHEQEIQRLLNDYSNRHSQSTVAELQGQIYTHQMVIAHLKEQLKQLTELKEENAMLKLERDHLEKTLMGANKKIQELQKPESHQYQNLLEKFENLEQRHEVREQKLQAIVRDLLARSAEPIPCGPVCRNKLLDKNREICYYRVEMDRILEALREFRRSK